MRHYWYTSFLVASLAIAVFWTGGMKIYGKTDTQISKESVESIKIAESQAMAESRETAESQTASESQTMVESRETAGYQETENSLKPAESLENAKNLKNTEIFPEHFQNVLFIGDSRTVGLYEYGQIEEGKVFADSGMTVFNLWSKEISFSDQGKKTLEQILTEHQYETIHVMLGINELGYHMDQIVKKYGETIEAIQRMQPEAQVVLGTNLHVTSEKSARSTTFNNQRINELNGEIQKIAEGLRCYYVDVNEQFDDEQGGLSKEYSSDGAHVMGKYYAQWVQWLGSQVYS